MFFTTFWLLKFEVFLESLEVFENIQSKFRNEKLNFLDN